MSIRTCGPPSWPQSQTDHGDQPGRHGGNGATIADPSWTPLVVTPPYAEYANGYSAVTGAFPRSLANALETEKVGVTLTSTVVPGVSPDYDSVGSLFDDVISARVWLGIPSVRRTHAQRRSGRTSQTTSSLTSSLLLATDHPTPGRGKRKLQPGGANTIHSS